MTRTLTTGIISFGIILLACLVFVLLQENLTRDHTLELAGAAGTIALACAVLGSLCHYLARRAVFDRRWKRVLAFLIIPTIIVLLAIASWSIGLTGSWGGILEIAIIALAVASLLAASLAIAIQSWAPLKYPKLAALLPTTAFAGFVALSLGSPSEDEIAAIGAMLAQRGYLECGESPAYIGDVERAVGRFQQSRGEQMGGSLSSEQRSVLEAAAVPTEFYVGGAEAEFATLEDALNRTCAMTGRITIRLSEGEHVFPLADGYPDWADVTAADPYAPELDNRALIITGAGPELTVIKSYTQVLLGAGDRLSDLTLQEAASPSGDESASAIVGLVGQEAALANVEVKFFAETSRQTGIAASPLPSSRIILDRVRIKGAKQNLLTVSDPPEIDAAGLSDSDTNSTEDTGEVVVTSSTFQAGASATALKVSGTTRVAIKNGSLEGNRGIDLGDAAQLSLEGVSITTQQSEAVWLTGQSTLTMQGGSISRTGEASCISAFDESSVELRAVDLAGCQGGRFYPFQLNNAVSATIQDSPGILESDIYSGSENVRLTFSAPATSYRTFTRSDGSGAFRSGRVSRVGHQAWLLSNYYNPLSFEATDCAFMAKSSQALLPAANFGAMMCVFSDRACKARDETVAKVVSEQRQCWAKMGREHNKLLQKAMTHPETCPKVSEAISGFSKWWNQGAISATSVVDANGNKPDPMRRTSAFNKIASDTFLDIIQNTKC